MSRPNGHLELKIRRRDQGQNVILIRFVVHAVRHAGGIARSENQVTQYLNVAGGKAVRINMRPRSQDVMNGVFEAKSHDTTESRTKVTEFSYEPTRDVTVLMLVNLFRDWKLDSYRFADEGEGCRYWHIIAMRLYEHVAWVDRNSSLYLLEQLVFRYSSSTDRILSTIVPGIFDDRDLRASARLWIGGIVQAQASKAAQALAQERNLRAVLDDMVNNQNHPGNAPIEGLPSTGQILTGERLARAALEKACQQSQVARTAKISAQRMARRAIGDDAPRRRQYRRRGHTTITLCTIA